MARSMDALATAPQVDPWNDVGRNSSTVCVGCGCAVLLLAAVVLAGWALGLTRLEQVAPSLPVMTPDTALALGCGGLTLVCLALGSRPRILGRCLGAIVAIIGLMVIFEYAVAPIGIDQLLFAVPGAVDPGRPSPHTAIALIALGCAFVTSDLRRAPGWVHQACLAVSAAVAASALVGYIYDVNFLRGLAPTDGMAVHTVAAVILLTIGAMALDPTRGLLGMMRAGGGGAVIARAVVPLACAPLVIGAVLLGMQRHQLIGVHLAMALVTLAMVGLVVVMLLVLAIQAQHADGVVRATSDRLQALFDHAPAALSLRSLDGRFLNVNEQTAAILGRSSRELIGTRPDQSPIGSAVAADDLAITLSGGPVAREERVRHADGRERDYQVLRFPVLGDGGEVIAFGTFAFDMTEQKQMIRALELAEERFRSTFEEAPIGMAVLALGGRLEQVNDALCQILGYAREQLEGVNSAALISEEDLGMGRALREALLAGTTDSRGVEARLRHGAGYLVEVDVHVALLRDSAGVPLHFVAQVQDITERKRDHAHLAHLADHDALTGVQNRRAFLRTLAQHTANDRRQGAQGALMVIDLDRFKRINDTLGHQAGDELLAHTAHLLRRRLRAGDVIARLGGDEFAVLLPQTPVDEAIGIGESLLDVLRDEPAQIAGLAGAVSASIGVASLGHRTDGSSREILRNADRAMYGAKASGGDRIEAWSPSEQRPDDTATSSETAEARLS